MMCPVLQARTFHPAKNDSTLVLPGLAAFAKASAAERACGPAKPGKRRAPGIQILLPSSKKDVHGRDKPGHVEMSESARFHSLRRLAAVRTRNSPAPPCMATI